MRVSVLGCGAIGGTVARALRDGHVEGAELVGVSHRDPIDPAPAGNVVRTGHPFGDGSRHPES
jgi:predicted dinucleotide-utilizing enzyme